MDRAIARLMRKASAKTKLRSFLDANEPELVKFLQTLWQNQGRAITYKEIREAILSGEFTEGHNTDGSFEGHEGANGYYAEKWLNEWRQDYSRFTIHNMVPAWEKAGTAGASRIPVFFQHRDFSGWKYNPAAAGVQSWMRTHGAVFVTNSTQTQLDGLKAVLRHAAATGMNVDELARYVRPFVGLTRDQYTANLKYYNTLRENGMSERAALNKAIRYGQRQHRFRGYNIARTELAFAYNHGALDGVKQAQMQGFIGAVEKYWSSADDERMCPVCSALDGVSLSLDEEFGHRDKHGEWIPINPRLSERTTKLVPPAHPSCRCAIGFREISDPVTGLADPGLVTIEAVPRKPQFDYIEEVPDTRPQLTEIAFPGADERTESIPSKPLTNAAGKPIIEAHKTLPTGGPSNGITQLTGKQGGITRNYYDADGRWIKQFTNNDHGNPKMHPFGTHGEHMHDVIWEKDKIVGRPIRELTPEETKENSDVL